jgi:hypothetical protein
MPDGEKFTNTTGKQIVPLLRLLPPAEKARAMVIDSQVPHKVPEKDRVMTADTLDDAHT